MVPEPSPFRRPVGADTYGADVHPPRTLREIEPAVRAAWGADVDLTREQFGPSELVLEPRVPARPPGAPKRGEARYRLLRTRVLAALATSG
jgi:hypothetical protein